MTGTRRRSQPLRVTDDDVSDEADPATPTHTIAPPAPTGTAPTDDHGSGDVGAMGIGHSVDTRTRTDDDRRSFAAAVSALRTGGGSLNLSERTLMVVGGITAPLGLLFVLLGWVGASRTPNLFEQIPYMISGGLFGLALVFLGSFFYFAHWITELVKEHRTQSVALLEALERLQSEVGNQPAVVVAEDAGGSMHHGDRAVLVATTRGSMVHRPDCVVVAGKHDLRTIDDVDGLAPCKLCDPLADDY